MVEESPSKLRLCSSAPMVSREKLAAQPPAPPFCTLQGMAASPGQNEWRMRSSGGCDPQREKGIRAHHTLFRDDSIYTQKYQMGQSQVLSWPQAGDRNGLSC